jgi:hypothetical protein
MADPVDCMVAIQLALDRFKVEPGSVTHAIAQVSEAMALEAEGFRVRLEQQVETVVRSKTGEEILVNRVVDSVATKLGERIHTETKTGRNIHDVLDPDQLTQDAAIAIQRGARVGLVNAWNLVNVEIGPQEEAAIKNRLTTLADNLLEQGFSTTQITRALERFQFTDAIGEAFKPSVEFVMSPEGPIAKVALEAASHSPDFHPAMEALFGPSGKVADAAVEAAAGTNLTPAEQSLEKKLQDGVTQALDQAGTAAKEHAAGKLTESISAGATSLGNVMTAIPQLYDSVDRLGEAWDKPLNSTKDYMNLLAAAGGAVSQAGQVLQAFSGITQVAAAAQAVFNAVMALNPVVLVVIAVVALIAMIALLITYWDQVKAALRDNPWLAVAASLFGIIGLIVVIIAYWDEIKLAVLVAANYISIQLKRIGYFFVGLGTLIGQVWDWITATVANVGIAIVNAFIAAGVAIENFFIGVINWILGKYNDLADSALGDLIGLSHADLIPEVDVQTKLIPPKEVPTIDVDAAFKPRQITGGLESQIAAQEQVVAEGQQKDADRRAAKAAEPAAAPPAGDMGSLGRPALPAAPGGALPGGAALPGGLAGGAAAPGADQSVRVEGGINVTINAERLEADSAKLLTDEFIAKVQARLGELRATQDFRVGARPQQA